MGARNLTNPNQFKFCMSDKLYEYLKEACNKSRRTLSAEIHLRLEATMNYDVVAELKPTLVKRSKGNA